jgi:hypothetical protein
MVAEVTGKPIGGNYLRKHIFVTYALALALILAVSFSAAADNPNVEELNQILNDINVVMNNLIGNGFVIEHLELDSISLDDTYRIPYPFLPGWEYIVVGIGGPAIADLDMYLYNSEGALEFSDTEPGKLASISLYLDAPGVYHSLLHAAELNDGYQEGSPYYFAVLIAAR